MDDQELPRKYDAIILGTGMTESIIAAALSRIGKTVLHLDCQNYYGENWASFNLENIEFWVEENKNAVAEKIHVDSSTRSFSDENETFVPLKRNISIKNICHNRHVTICNSETELTDDEGNNETHCENKMPFLNANQEYLMKHSKRFNLDLCPKLLYSKGAMVNLLISSNVAKYAEFKSLNRVLTWRKKQLEPVPCSRADVFATKNVSVVQKRILIKILTLFANYTDNLDEFKGFEEKTLMDFLIYKKVPDNLIHYILYALAMGDEKTSCLSGVKACKAFLDSLGKYGNTPFIFPMYGSGELPQCFCRLCAVFGGIYCLNRGINSLILKGNKCTGVISNGIRLNAESVILSSSYCLEGYSSASSDEMISRGIVITNKSIQKCDKDSLTLLQFPPVPQLSNNPVTVMELGSGTNTCPENFYVVHLTTKASNEASTDLKFVIDSLFDIEGDEHSEEQSKPQILWSLMWNVSKGNCSMEGYSSLENVKICENVDSEFDYETSINQAKKIFFEMHPGEEFLPRAPDPDEIALDSETCGTEFTHDDPIKAKCEVGNVECSKVEFPGNQESAPTKNDQNNATFLSS
ncbi:hypothetical protein RUM43_006704 [Polyplax serrata]|uniref:Rab proteins geranylgeranyltransferase component A n=1 Tax=Polyplax serrata TaxID=468196 RepID=A0AAN8S2C8_POLSC